MIDAGRTNKNTEAQKKASAPELEQRDQIKLWLDQADQRQMNIIYAFVKAILRKG